MPPGRGRPLAFVTSASDAQAAAVNVRTREAIEAIEAIEALAACSQVKIDTGVCNANRRLETGPASFRGSSAVEAF